MVCLKEEYLLMHSASRYDLLVNQWRMYFSNRCVNVFIKVVSKVLPSAVANRST